MILRYAITDPAYYTSNSTSLKNALLKVLSGTPIDMICLRDKHTKNYAVLAETFLSVKSLFPQTKFLLHTDLELAAELKADGIHLPSNLIGDVKKAKALGLWTIVSCHTLEEAVRCEESGADAVTFSPVFSSPGKGPPQGLEKLKEIKDRISIKIFALGGVVTEEQIVAVEKAGADGFASIRYFVE